MIFMFYEYFLPIIIFLGLITSYEDSYEGKIKNKYIIICIVLGILVHAYLLYSQSIKMSYIPVYLVNIALAVIIGFGLYFIDFWSAGDGKLFIAYAFVIPFTAFSSQNLFSYLNPVVLLVNTFIPYFLFSAAIVFITNLSTHKRDTNLGKIIQSAVFSLVYVFSITWIVELILGLVGLPNNPLAVILFSSILVILFEKFRLSVMFFNSIKRFNTRGALNIFFNLKGKEEMLLMIIISIARIIFDYKNVLTLDFLLAFIVYYLVISFIRHYFRHTTSKYFVKKVHLLNLTKGMIINDKIIKKDDKYIRNPVGKEFRSFSFSNMNISRAFANVLDDEDVKEIAKLYKKGRFTFKHVTIQNTLPFAPLMFLGVIITILTQGALIFLIHI